MGYSLGVLNNIRANASDDYQGRIPEATRENIQAIGNALQTYTVLYNEFCTALFNKIGKTMIEQKMFKNRLARFKQGTVMNQQDVEEIFIEMAKAEGSYDKDGKNPLGRRNPPDVKPIYHRMNRQDYYCVSVGDIDFTRVFRSEATLDSFITGIINSIYSGANYDEWIAMKNVVATYDGYFDVIVPDISTSEGFDVLNYNGYSPESIEGVNGMEGAKTIVAKNFVKSVRKILAQVSFPSAKFNDAHVKTWSEPSEMVLMINSDLLAEIDVEVLSRAFNMGKTDIQVEIIPMDDFGTLENTYAILIDKDWFRVYDTLSHFEPQRNAQGMFTNYFYHVHQILSASRFKNAIRFAITPPAGE